MKAPLVSRALTISLYIIFALGVLGTVTLPYMLEFYTGLFYDSYSLNAGYRNFILTFLIMVAIPGLWIVLEMIWMLRSIPQDPFIIRNVRALKRIGVILIVLAALFFAKCFVYVTFLTLMSGLLLILCGLFAFTMSDLFRRAVAFKEENDLTI